MFRNSREKIERAQQKSCQNDQRIFKQFCENTSIHGLKYLFEDGSRLIERYIFPFVFSTFSNHFS